MAGKHIELPDCPALVEDLARVLRQYAEAAYPVGGSECGQVAREALLNVVEALHARLANGEAASISRRLRAPLRAALHYERELAAARQASFAARAALLEALLAGEPVDAGQYVAAGEADRRAGL